MSMLIQASKMYAYEEITCRMPLSNLLILTLCRPQRDPNLLEEFISSMIFQ